MSKPVAFQLGGKVKATKLAQQSVIKEDIDRQEITGFGEEGAKAKDEVQQPVSCNSSFTLCIY